MTRGNHAKRAIPKMIGEKEVDNLYEKWCFNEIIVKRQYHYTISPKSVTHFNYSFTLLILCPFSYNNLKNKGKKKTKHKRKSLFTQNITQFKFIFVKININIVCMFINLEIKDSITLISLHYILKKKIKHILIVYKIHPFG